MPKDAKKESEDRVSDPSLTSSDYIAPRRYYAVGELDGETHQRDAKSDAQVMWCLDELSPSDHVSSPTISEISRKSQSK